MNDSPTKNQADNEALFGFAVISDTHDAVYCGLGQGLTPEAVKLINKMKPEFVIGVGDLVSGGGDCLKHEGKVDLITQLNELRDKVLKPLKAPFVPLAGNHDFESKYSSGKSYPRRIWKKFWKKNRKYIFEPARSNGSSKNHRFTHRGIGFSLISYYGNYGLYQDELDWIEENVQRGDFVFRHINPYGIAEANPFYSGIAMRDYVVKEIERLPGLLKKKRVRALFSGHTHAFYDGICDGLRFVNTGALGVRAMEYIIGWRNSTFKNRQAFVWVDVLKNLRFKINFYVWDPTKKRFFLFDKRRFPKTIRARKRWRIFFREGAAALCTSCRH